MNPHRNGALPRAMPESGIYLFSEEGKPLYVGRSRQMKQRYGRHCNPGATYRSAAFAFQLAREETGFTKASYKAGESSRAGLMKNPIFSSAFDAMKARIRLMEYRFVEETDPTRQTLLEVYCAVALSTPYNDFQTH